MNSLFEVVRRHALESPDTIASIEASQNDSSPGDPSRMTYRELYDAAVVLSGTLKAVRETQTSSKEQLPSGCSSIATWMRRGNKWYCIYAASMKLQVPLVALSSDLPDKASESQRNKEIIAAHRPQILIVDETADIESLRTDLELVGTEVIHFNQLLQAGGGQDDSSQVQDPDAILCYNYTGGTTKASRCAKITHRMALFEIATYPTITTLKATDVVLQQHSMYWAASAYGEIDIALTFGCALLFLEDYQTTSVIAAIKQHNVSCAGLVPSILASLQPRDVPSLRLVFTWGEALQPRIAEEWAAHVHLIDLLISTEYWLSFYADWTRTLRNDWNGGSRPPFRTVDGVKVELRPPSSDASIPVSATNRVGELWVSGPMVCPGYLDDKLNEGVFRRSEDGRVWYCTRDCLEQHADGGLTFACRADDLVKVGGKWLDVAVLEESLRAVPGVAEVCVSGTEVFVALASPLQPDVLAHLRLLCPPDFHLFAVPALSRNVVTNKVDRKRLRLLAAGECPEQVSSTTLCGSSRAARKAAKELAMCQEELESNLFFYLPLVVLGALPVLRAGMSSFHAFQTDPVTDALLHSTSELVGVLLEVLCCRLPCLNYMLYCRFKFGGITRWFRLFPTGTVGAAIMVAAFLPDARLVAVLASPGMCLTWLRNRFVSWHCVCALGFPYWARDDFWYSDKGFLATVKWYLDGWWKEVEKFWNTTGLPLCWWKFKKYCVSNPSLKESLLSMEYARECKWCKVTKFSYEGRVNLETDQFWYCDVCWQSFDRHKKCSICQKWKVRFEGDPSTIVCTDCAKQKQGQKRARERSISSMMIRLFLDIPAAGSPNASTSSVTANVSDVDSPDADPVSDGPDQQIGGLGGEADEDLSKPPIPRKRQKASEGQTAGSAVPKCTVWRAVERVLGVTFSSPSAALPNLDSLRRTKLLSALRREVRRAVTREAITRAHTLAELINAVESMPLEDADVTKTQKEDQREYAIWGMMWSSKCEWIVCRNKPVSEAAFRAVIPRLVDRHEALRAELADPYPLWKITQQALTALELWRGHGVQVCRRRLRFAPSKAIRRGADSFISWGLRQAWPRVRSKFSKPRRAAWLPLFTQDANETNSLIVLPRSATQEEAQSAIWAEAKNFKPPFRTILAPFGEVEEEGALIYLAVTHMLADGYCVVPLLNDLAQLVANIEAEADPFFFLVPLPNTFASLESRLVRTINHCGSEHVGPDRCLITRDPLKNVPATDSESVTEYCDLPAHLVTAIRDAAQRLAVPDDIALLATVGVALAWLKGNRSQPFITIVPQRDGDTEQDMVGLLADFRQLAINTADLHFAGAAMLLNKTVRERLWLEPGLGTQGDLPMVNCMWTDFDSPHGFTQHVRPSRRQQYARYPMQVVVEQSAQDVWHITVAFRASRYSEYDRNRFFFLLEESFVRLCQNPLELLWPQPQPLLAEPMQPAITRNEESGTV